MKKFKKTGILSLMCAALLAAGCSSSEDKVKEALNKINNKPKALKATEFSGVYLSDCILNEFKNAYRVIEAEFKDDNSFTYYSTSYSDGECLEESGSESFSGAYVGKESLGEGTFRYELQIPINENTNSIKGFNALENEQGIMISDFYYNDSEASEEFNKPSIQLFKFEESDAEDDPVARVSTIQPGYYTVLDESYGFCDMVLSTSASNGRTSQIWADALSPCSYQLIFSCDGEGLCKSTNTTETFVLGFLSEREFQLGEESNLEESALFEKN